MFDLLNRFNRRLMYVISKHVLCWPWKSWANKRGRGPRSVSSPHAAPHSLTMRAMHPAGLACTVPHIQPPPYLLAGWEWEHTVLAIVNPSRHPSCWLQLRAPLAKHPLLYHIVLQTRCLNRMFCWYQLAGQSSHSNSSREHSALHLSYSWAAPWENVLLRVSILKFIMSKNHFVKTAATVCCLVCDCQSCTYSVLSVTVSPLPIGV